MMCDGVRSYDCWNAMTVDQSELAQAVAAKVFHEIESLPNFDSRLSEQIHAEADQLQARQDSGLKELHEVSVRLRREIDNFADAIAGGLASPTILARLTATEHELQSVSDAIADVNKNAPKAIVIPTADEIRKIASDTFLGLSVEDLEFGRILRELVSDFYVLPYRLIDGGHISPRCVFTLDIAALRGVHLPDELATTSIHALVDLTRLPQRVIFREQVCRLRASGLTEREVATQLSITHTAAQRAATLDREMTRLGLADPWVPVRDDQAAADCYKRILNDRYCFNPLPGFVCRFPNT